MLGGGLVILGNLIKLFIGDDIMDEIEKLVLNRIIFTNANYLQLQSKTVFGKRTDE